MFLYCTCDGIVCKTNAHPIDTNNHDMILPGRPTLQLTFNSEGFGESISVNELADIVFQNCLASYS